MFAVRVCDREEAAEALHISSALGKLKGDMLLMYHAIDSEATLQIDRDAWMVSVRDAQDIQGLSAALVSFVDRMDPDWIQPWFFDLPNRCGLRVDEATADKMEVDGKDTDANAGGVRPGERGGQEVGAAETAGDAVGVSHAKAQGETKLKLVTSMAVLALQLYGLDEAILYQVPNSHHHTCNAA